MKPLLCIIALVGITLLGIAAYPAPAFADGLIVVDCPSIVLPPAPPIEIQPLAPGVAPTFPSVRVTPRPVPPRPSSCPSYLTVKNHVVTVTIENQIARTHVDETFLNETGNGLEGTYIFPLPEDAAISDFAMWVDGKRLEGQVLDWNQARRIYEEIVRSQRDPALLEYVGRNAFQARIFPIPPRSQKRVEIEYSQVIRSEGGLVRYVYPLNTEKFSPKPLASVSVNVTIRSNAALKAIYSPSHNISVFRDGNNAARIGYEGANVTPNQDFVLYFSVSQDEIGLNLLSYRSAGEDGFFLLLVAPKVNVVESQVIAKDVILVLDTSGSMQGAKLDQAKRALGYVLDQLGKNDRFNIISFSTGTNPYASSLRPISSAQDARNYVARLRAEGSTDINRALLEALAGTDPERTSMVIFLTDGLPTTGETNAQRIISNVTAAAPKNVRLFAFGVGDDVNTVLLDTLADQLHGASAYVRPNERIDEAVTSFYSKVTTPVLSNVTIDWGGAVITDAYPFPLPDLFAGGQLIVAGRYRNPGPTAITLKGMVNGVSQTFKYSDQSFRERGGEDSIPRLWATRKIGYLLNQMRLYGESKEAVNEIVRLALRYGIVTPYTSFLIDERQDPLTSEGKGGAAQNLSRSLAPSAMPTSGAAAVQHSQDQSRLFGANVAPTYAPKAGSAGTVSVTSPIQTVGDKTFILRGGVWTDTQFEPFKTKTLLIEFGSEAYFSLLAARPELGRYFGLGSRVIALVGGIAYETSDDGRGAKSPDALPRSMLPLTVPVARPAGQNEAGPPLTPNLAQAPIPALVQSSSLGIWFAGGLIGCVVAAGSACVFRRISHL